MSQKNVEDEIKNAEVKIKNVEDEIEQFLVDKISHAINRLDDQQNIMVKLYSIKGEFVSVLDCLENKKKKPNNDMDGVRMNSLYSLQNMVTEWQLTMNKSPLSYKQACESISKRLKKMKKEINGEESSSRGDREGSTRHQKPSQEPKQKPDHPVFEINKAEVYRWSSRHPPTKVRGSDHRVLEMEREIVMHNPNAACKMFGVVGAPGIGKTTLCQTIFGRDSVKQRFCPRIWVCLSKKPTDIKDYRKEIVIRILKSLGIDDEVINDADKEPDQKTGTGESHDTGLKRLILLLRLQLTGKRYLIVLDDAWNDDKNVAKFFSNLNQKDRLDENWGEELAYGLPKGCGGTVISSSTSSALLKQMLGDDVSLQNLTRHTDETIYEIFKDTVIGYDGNEKEFPQYLEELKGELLKKCDGNPLAAKLLAKIAQNAQKRLNLESKTQPQPATTTDAGKSFDPIKQFPPSGVEQLNSGVRDGEEDKSFPSL
ncbi:hypothetical protein R6Q59_016691 [Mikania micrantha]